MARNARHVNATPEAVFAVLSDGWLYPVWVVGASRIRGVDTAWPAVGASLAHSFGAWPLLINDSTTVLALDAPRRMVLRPRGWPVMGEAQVTLTVEPEGAGSRVRIEEHPVKGPGRLVPRWIMDTAVFVRNRETLRRLAYLAEGGAR
jgi:hypothetical protein